MMFILKAIDRWWNWLMKKEFCCKGKQLADYLVKHGSKLLRIENKNGVDVHIFEYDESIDKNINQYEVDKKKWLF